MSFSAFKQSETKQTKEQKFTMVSLHSLSLSLSLHDLVFLWL